MRATAAAPAVLGRDHPEWKPWLALLVEMQRALGQPPWARLVSPEPDAAASDAPSSVPRLDGAVVAVDPPAVRQFVRDLFTIAGLSASWPRVAADGRESLGLLEAAVCQDTGRLEEWAHRLNVLFPALSAVATVAAMPLLHACRQASKEPPGWTEGYCPVCGAWPVLAEARGLERSRQLRCARCGCDWRADWLRCPFCRNGDHTRLGSLVGESTLETFRIETCAVCRGYLKTLTTLRPTPADAVVLVDLGSVDLDVAALEHGYGRPGEPGYPVRARLVPGA